MPPSLKGLLTSNSEANAIVTFLTSSHSSSGEVLSEITGKYGLVNISSKINPARIVHVDVAYHWRPVHHLKRRSAIKKSTKKDMPARQGAIPMNLTPGDTLDKRGSLSS
ncbi:hypothetical protein Nepgr_016465 [Nepenthes gracilis]|uniref:Uncharacterized protein n=1 Tax=Nepenthes gracilis TaxID=150966 RepID=A0AAD3XS48_NEPGR|nr:hypothetical protein Nepgr_016465 [Nepenthes gracilis]